MIITILMFCMMAAVIMQKKPSRMVITFTYTFIALGTDFLMGYLSGMYYFVAMMSGDSLCTILLGITAVIFQSEVKLILRLIYLSVASIIVNFLGWVMWIEYQPSSLYVILMTIIYTIAVISMMDMRKPTVRRLRKNGNNGDNRASARFNSHDVASSVYRDKSKAKVCH